MLSILYTFFVASLVSLSFGEDPVEPVEPESPIKSEESWDHGIRAWHLNAYPKLRVIPQVLPVEIPKIAPNNIDNYNLERMGFLTLIKTDGVINCVGSLFTTNIVITAKNCFTKDTVATELEVLAGVIKVDNSEQWVKVKNLVVPAADHRYYIGLDFAILRLVKPMVGTNIHPIQLCSGRLFKGQFVEVMGWTLASNGQADHLESKRLRLKKRENCEETGYYGIYATRMEYGMCGIPEYEGNWKRFLDGGAPVVYKRELCGIISVPQNKVDAKKAVLFMAITPARRIIRHYVKKWQSDDCAKLVGKKTSFFDLNEGGWNRDIPAGDEDGDTPQGRTLNDHIF